MLRIMLILFFPIAINAQSRYEWNAVTKITFCDLTFHQCPVTELSGKLPAGTREIHYRKPAWENVLHFTDKYLLPITEEERCYVLIIYFSNGRRVPFAYYHQQRAIRDISNNKYYYFAPEVFKQIDKIFKRTQRCLHQRDCYELK